MLFKNVEMSMRTIDLKDLKPVISYSPIEDLSVVDVIVGLGKVIGCDKKEVTELVNKVLDEDSDNKSIEIRDRRTFMSLYVDAEVVVVGKGFLIIINDHEESVIDGSNIDNPITTINIYRGVKEFLSKFKRK